MNLKYEATDLRKDLHKGGAQLNIASELVFIQNCVIPYCLKLLQSV